MATELSPDGTEWVRSVPRSWRVEPLKYHCSMFKGLPILKTDLVEEGEPVISYGQIHSKGNTGTHLDDSLLRFIPASRVLGSESSKLRRGDVVFADTSEDVEGIGNAALIDTDGDVYAGYHTVTCRPDQKSLSGRYLAYLARTDAWRYQLRNLAMGVKVFSITQAILRKSEVLLPPRDEQERIADFLDERCAAIDAAAELICRHTSSLELYRRSIIYETATKGLNPRAPMKFSRAEWVRSVPRSWRVEPLKYHCSMFKGLPILKTDLVEEGEPVISYGQIHSKGNTGTHLDDSLLRFIPASRVLGSESSKLRRGDVVFADTSEDVEGIGNAALIDTDGDVYAGYHTVTCRPDQKSLSGRYLAYLARTDAWRYQLRNLAMGVKVFSITQAILRKSEVLLPPRDEQERIADFLDERCAAIDAVIDTKRRQLDVLKRRRQSLIYEYVTGKRRVSAKG